MKTPRTAAGVLVAAGLLFGGASVGAQDPAAGTGLFDFGSLPTLDELAPATRFENLDRIVAVVNGDVVVSSELERAMFETAQELRDINTRIPPEETLRRQVLERLIVEKLQVQAASRLGIRVEDAAVNEMLSGVARRNQMELTEFRQALSAEGIDIAAYRETIRRELLIARLQEREIGKRVRVTDRDIDNFLSSSTGSASGGEEIRLREILLALPQSPSPERIAEVRTQAQGLVAELGEGANFADLAAEYSEGRTALSGGDLGFRKVGELPEYLAKVAAEMQAGEDSGVIRSANGFSVVRLEERRSADSSVIIQSRVRHILMQPGPELSADEALRRLQILRQRLLVNGEPFDALARAHSQDSTSALRGGDIGWVTPGDVVPRFQQVVDTLPPGNVSEPFETRFGWHILEVLDRREFDNSSEASRARAAERIRARKVDEEMTGWLRQLRDEAFVELRLDPL